MIVLDPGLVPDSVTLIFIRLDSGNSIAIALFNGVVSLLTGEPPRTSNRWAESNATEAGRIRWISKEARQHMGAPVHEKYKLIIATMYVSFEPYPSKLKGAECYLESEVWSLERYTQPPS